MAIVLTINMKKIMEQVVQKNVKGRQIINSLEQLEMLKINMEEATTFHNVEQNELEDVIKNIEPKDKQPIGNHPPKLWHIKIELEISQESIQDYTKNQIHVLVT